MPGPRGRHIDGWKPRAGRILPPSESGPVAAATPSATGSMVPEKPSEMPSDVRPPATPPRTGLPVSEVTPMPTAVPTAPDTKPLPADPRICPIEQPWTADLMPSIAPLTSPPPSTAAAMASGMNWPEGSTNDTGSPAA